MKPVENAIKFDTAEFLAIDQNIRAITRSNYMWGHTFQRQKRLHWFAKIQVLEGGELAQYNQWLDHPGFQWNGPVLRTALHPQP